MPKASIADHELEWRQLVARATANAEDLPFLAELVAELQKIVEVVPQLEQERLALTARSQQLTRDIDAYKGRGRIVAARIRSGLKTKYGHGSEKLTEFGLRPRRRRLRDQQAEQAAMDKLTDADPVS